MSEVRVVVKALRLEQRIGVCVERNGWAHSFAIHVKDGELPRGYEDDPEIMAACGGVRAQYEKSASMAVGKERARRVSILIENDTIGDGPFSDEVASVLEAYAAQIKRGEAGHRADEVLALPSGTRLRITAVL